MTQKKTQPILQNNGGAEINERGARSEDCPRPNSLFSEDQNPKISPFIFPLSPIFLNNEHSSSPEATHQLEPPPTTPATAGGLTDDAIALRSNLHESLLHQRQQCLLLRFFRDS